ncbi:MAG: hypothetical protein ACTSYF_07040 [Promethearchaeota archaeon]
MGAIVLEDTVSSISGTYNEELTLTTHTSMTTNEYAGYLLFLPDRLMNYAIESNTSDTITLDTPSVAYFDMTSKKIQVKKTSDYFGKNESGEYPEINSSLQINNSDGSVEQITETDLDLILPMIENKVHDLINRIDNPFTYSDRGYYTVKNVIISMLMRWNRRRQYNRRTNQLELRMDAYIPDFTPNERADLLRIASSSDQESFVFDQYDSYGRKISTTSYGGTLD